MPFKDFTQGKVVKIWDGITGPLYHSDKITFGYFTLEENTDLPVHSHIHEQWTHLLEGELFFDINGDRATMKPGMMAYIPPNTPHSGKAVTRCQVIDVFIPVREDFVAKEKATPDDNVLK
ncbi:MAG TPA: cupin domain-containing protein [Puia sp.]|nr:cupin domain-containing protein [Puia sp.]